MRSTFYFVVAALMAALQTQVLAPALAVENAAPPPAQATPPPSQAQPQPQGGQPEERQHQEQRESQSQGSAGPDSGDRDSDDRRFVFHRVDGNLLRLDMRTGAVAMCSPTGADWTCVPGRDDRAALDRQIAQLQRDNAALKNALLEHGVQLPAGMMPPPPGGGGWSGDETIPRPPQTVPPTAAPGNPPQGSPAQGASSEGGVDRIVNAVEKGWQRLVEVMTNLKRDLER